MLRDDVDTVLSFVHALRGGAALCRPSQRESHRWTREPLLSSVPETTRWRWPLKRRWPPRLLGWPLARGSPRPGPWPTAGLHSSTVTGQILTLQPMEVSLSCCRHVCVCVLLYLCYGFPLWCRFPPCRSNLHSLAFLWRGRGTGRRRRCQSSSGSVAVFCLRGGERESLNWCFRHGQTRHNHITLLKQSWDIVITWTYLAIRWSKVISITLWMPSLSMSLMVKYWIPRFFRMLLQWTWHEVKTAPPVLKCRKFTPVTHSEELVSTDRSPGSTSRRPM